MNKYIKITLLFTVIIFSTIILASAKSENSTYTVKKGETVEYVIDSFHNKFVNSFGVNISNHTIEFQKGTHFNITVESVNSTNVNFELVYNNLKTSNLSQSYFSLFDFLHKSSNSTNGYLIQHKNGYNYYVSGDFYYQDYSTTVQEGTSFYNQTTIDNSWNWKTGWLASFNLKRNAFEFTSKQEYNVFYDLGLQITMVGLNTNSSKPLPAFQMFSLFAIALIPIMRRLRNK